MVFKGRGVRKKEGSMGREPGIGRREGEERKEERQSRPGQTLCSSSAGAPCLLFPHCCGLAFIYANGI